MEFTVVEGLRTLKLDLVVTLALAALFLFIGYGLQQRVPPLARSSIPAPAIGGLLFALLVLALRARGTLGVALDSSLRAPLQTVFFTTIGLSATLALLRTGGWRMIFFLLIASATAIVQNVVGIGVAQMMGAPAPLGIICGALTLTGGPATGLAFTNQFEQMGIAGAGALIIASATFGIFTASLVGNPTATALISRFHLARRAPSENVGASQSAIHAYDNRSAQDMSDTKEKDFWSVGPTGEASAQRYANEAESVAEAKYVAGAENSKATNASLTGSVLLRNLMIILLVMGVGALVSLGLARLSLALPPGVGKYLNLPGYIGAMIVASIVRNMDDRLGWFKINPRAVEALGTIALALFLVIALMDLKLWQLAGLAVPMLVILAIQVIVTVIYAVLVTFILMGRDYEAAVTTSGHIGFGLGITPNAVANMEALTERYAPAPRSFLIVPVVGAFFIDFTNVIIITFFINLLR